MDWLPSLKDILYVAAFLVNLVWILAVNFNHIRHLRDDVKEVKKDIDKLFSLANANREKIAKIEGRMNGKRGITD